MQQKTFLYSTLFSALILCSTAGIASGQSLALTEIQPANGGPGDRVQLHGHGFEDSSASSFLAWVFDGERGSVLDVTGKDSQNQLSARVADVPADIEGSVVLWQGLRTPLPPFTLEDGQFGVRDAFVFEPAKTAQGPSFAATAGSLTGSYAGTLIDGAIHFELRGQDPDGQPGELAEFPSNSYDIDEITVEGSGESCGPPAGEEPDEGDDQGGDVNPATARGFGFGFRIECLGAELCRGNPASLLAATLERVLEGMDVEIEFDDSTVVLSLSQPMCGAALNAMLSPAPERVTTPTPLEEATLASQRRWQDPTRSSALTR